MTLKTNQTKLNLFTTLAYVGLTLSVCWGIWSPICATYSFILYIRWKLIYSYFICNNIKFFHHHLWKLWPSNLDFSNFHMCHSRYLNVRFSKPVLRKILILSRIFPRSHSYFQSIFSTNWSTLWLSFRYLSTLFLIWANKMSENVVAWQVHLVRIELWYLRQIY